MKQPVEAASIPPPSLPANVFTSAPAEDDPPASPAPVDPAGDFPPRSVSIEPPQFLTAFSPSSLASTILAGAISSKLQASEAKPEAELMRLQIALEERMRSQR